MVSLSEQLSISQTLLFGVGEETQLPIMVKPSEDALTIRDVVAQVKDVEFKS